MFIKPNEFEAFVKAHESVSPPSSPALRLSAGVLFLAALFPLILLWWAMMLVGMAGMAGFKAARGAFHLAYGAADHAGMLIVG